MIKTDLNDFVANAALKHGNKYDYSLVNYKNNKTHIQIICPIHGEFSQRADCHLKGQGCKKCATILTAQKKKLTKKEFIKKSVEKHGNKYDYSNVEYINNSTKIKIICFKHGLFLQTPQNHLNGNGCPKCMAEKFRLKINNFILKSNLIHGNKYDYSLSEYSNNKTSLIIICKTHGQFLQTPSQHMSGHGCPKCGGTSKLNTDDFIEYAKEVHQNKYDYTLVLYKNNATKVSIICKSHGTFHQTPNRHLQGDGCPKCKSSKGELQIRKYLDKNSFIYKEQLGFENCKNKRKLPFDFVITRNNKICIIEYHGEQHYKLVNFSSKKEKAQLKFDQVKSHDKIKKQWCENNGIPLCIIPYSMYLQIEKILDEFFNEVKA